MSLDYLQFVESHEKYDNFNVFEKVLMATQRAKAIYEEEKAREAEEEQEKRKSKRKVSHKPTYQAILEINEGRLHLMYSDEEVIQPSPETPESEETFAPSETIIPE